jgi:signal transduction histidine kinase
LINNAFYAVNEKAARHSDPEQRDGEESYDYQPMVTVSTKILPPTPLPDRQAGSRGGQKGIEISVRDNGDGIPEQVREKIFQPFFTTKPTGSGTGLGLSLSYDIVKAHGGNLTFDKMNGGGVKFIIQLPLL